MKYTSRERASTMVVMKGLAMTAGSKPNFLANRGRGATHKFRQNNRDEQREADHGIHGDGDIGVVHQQPVDEQDLAEAHGGQLYGAAKHGGPQLPPDNTSNVREVDLAQAQGG